MQRFSVILILSLTLIASVGCSMCCGPDDFNYPTYGGIHQRADPARGRVGSIFSDPYANVAGLSADSNLEPYPEPKSNTDTGAFDDDDDFEDDDDDDFDDDFDREDEDLDDDLEDLDSEDELESIDPLDDDMDSFDDDIDTLDEDTQPELDGAKKETTTASRRRWRRRR